MSRPPLFPLLIALLLGGCTELPDLGGRSDPTARARPYPAIQPTAPVVALTQGGITAQTTQDIAATGAATQARADALRSRELAPPGDSGL